MIKFNQKKLESSLSVGEQLKEVRESNDVSLDELTKKTKIKKDYLEYLENGEYLKLPGEAFVRNFILTYANFFNLNPKTVIALYEEERKVFSPAQQEKVVKRSFVEAAHRKKSLNISRIVRYLIIAVVIGSLLTYLGLEVQNILEPPTLELASPASDMVTEERYIEIVGQTSPEAKVTINDQIIAIDVDGNFNESISLQPGLNEIQIVAWKEHGRKATIIREVLVKE